MLGGLKCYTSTHTCPFVCSQHVVTGHWDWIVFDLHAQKYLNWLRSSDSNLVTKFLSSLVQVMACHKVGANHQLHLPIFYILNLTIIDKVIKLLFNISNNISFTSKWRLWLIIHKSEKLLEHFLGLYNVLIFNKKTFILVYSDTQIHKGMLVEHLN